MTDATIVTEDITANTKLITISGQLDESNVDNKAKEIYQIFETNQGKINMIFDFAGLDYMNSKSIGYLTDWYGKITERGGKICIAHAKTNIKDILQVVGLTQLIQLFESLEEAKTSINDGTPVQPNPTSSTDTFKINA